SRRQSQQLALCYLRRWCRHRLHGSGQHPRREIVDPLEGAAPRCRRELAREEQPLERQLAVAPAPPGAAAGPGVREFRRGNRATVRHLAADLVDVFLLLAPEEVKLA